MTAALLCLVAVILFLLAYIVFLHYTRTKEMDMILAGMLSQNPYEYAQTRPDAAKGRIAALEAKLKETVAPKVHPLQKAI